VDQTRRLPLLTTRRFPYAPWLQTHIDYVWTYGIDDLSLEAIDIPGSDHRGFKIEIGY
jgi:hypothetical protein